MTFSPYRDCKIFLSPVRGEMSVEKLCREFDCSIGSKQRLENESIKFPDSASYHQSSRSTIDEFNNNVNCLCRKDSRCFIRPFHEANVSAM